MVSSHPGPGPGAQDADEPADRVVAPPGSGTGTGAEPGVPRGAGGVLPGDRSVDGQRGDERGRCRRLRSGGPWRGLSVPAARADGEVRGPPVAPRRSGRCAGAPDEGRRRRRRRANSPRARGIDTPPPVFGSFCRAGAGVGAMIGVALAAAVELPSRRPRTSPPRRVGRDREHPDGGGGGLAAHGAVTEVEVAVLQLGRRQLLHGAEVDADDVARAGWWRCSRGAGGSESCSRPRSHRDR